MDRARAPQPRPVPTPPARAPVHARRRLLELSGGPDHEHQAATGSTPTTQPLRRAIYGCQHLAYTLSSPNGVGAEATHLGQTRVLDFGLSGGGSRSPIVWLTVSPG